MQKYVKVWLYVGLIMLFFQIFIGGVTRLTGSGLSITKWEIVTGTIPPLTEQAWNESFDLYKETPQYQKINEGMSLSEFKWIYFWEYFHRLWARTMGFVFIIPFLIFYFKGALSKNLIKRLGVVVGLAAVTAAFGWIMVASGLVNRPWVNAYKLSLHLLLGFSVYAALWWAILQEFYGGVQIPHRVFRHRAVILFVMIMVQIGLGGLMSGLKAGLFFPTWPDMNSEIIPQIFFDIKEWNVDNLIHYDTNTFAPALIQFLHRGLAYVIFGLAIYFSYKVYVKNLSKTVNKSIIVFVFLLITQVVLGIMTLISCKGNIPVGLGVAHQAVAVFLMSSIMFLIFIFGRKEGPNYN